MPALPDATETRVEEIWRAARACDGRLFNGVVFSADSVSAERIAGHWTEFRRVLAQMRRPDLATSLALRPLAVTGLLRCADGIVLGRREAGAAYLAGQWQSVPAGSVERRGQLPHAAAERPERPERSAPIDNAPVDLAAQITAECEEELGLAASALRVGAPLIAFEHAESGVVDVGIGLSTALDFAAVEQGWRRHGNQEYDRLALATAARTVLPGTRALLLAGGEA